LSADFAASHNRIAGLEARAFGTDFSGATTKPAMRFKAIYKAKNKADNLALTV
jgi:hypothetical protein